MSWGFAIIGLSASNSETAQLAAFPILFPLTFASSAFVPVTSMPGWLQAFAKNQPVSQVIDACPLAHARAHALGVVVDLQHLDSPGLVGGDPGGLRPAGRLAVPAAG